MDRETPSKHTVKNGGKHLKLYMHPPSIPTRFQTIHFDDNEQKGFSSTARRFDRMLDDLPGPAYYATAAEKVEKLGQDASLSSKGYGVGFASNTRRFSKPPTELETTLPTSPAQYAPKTPVYSHSLASSLSPAFRMPIADNMDFNETVSPGPAFYDAHLKGRSGKWRPVEEAGASFVFKSRTSRSNFNDAAGKKMPPPGAYNVAQAHSASQPTLQGACAAFKATMRKTMSDPKMESPGPTAYNVTNVPKRTLHPRRVHVGTISKPAQRVHTPTSHGIAIPGSGMTPIAFPHPGKYEIARGADFIQKSVPALRSIFVSRSERFPEPFGKTNPSPGYYHPISDLKFRSYHLNLDKVWSH